jgi:leucyl aminopeptidase
MNTVFRFQLKYPKDLNSIPVYNFIVCDHIEKTVREICKRFNITSIPPKIFELENRINERILYHEHFQIVFYIFHKDYKCNLENLYNVMGMIGKKMSVTTSLSCTEITETDPDIIQKMVISYVLGYYQFLSLKTDVSKKPRLHLFFHMDKKCKSIIEEAIYRGTVQNEVRSLINTPANMLTIETYSKYIQHKTRDMPHVKCRIIGEKELRKMGCNLILGVNQGSQYQAQMIVLEYLSPGYTKKNKGKPTVLIGKGVMFDAGGYNIKRGNFADMKQDLAGSAIVYGIFKIMSELKTKGHLIGILPLVENMVDSHAIHPGDVLKAYNGKTVEVVDTDAEGRLIMADCLAYAEKFKPSLCIDIATLTGQAGAIFGNQSSVIMGNHNAYIQKMIQCGKRNNEKIWELPMWKEYIEWTQSSIADYKNYSYDIQAGTIIAGAFLSNFVPKNTAWIHLDIAGVDSLSSSSQIRHSGATGEILQSLLDFIQTKERPIYEQKNNK